jgi:hypothetical protein
MINGISWLVSALLAVVLSAASLCLNARCGMRSHNYNSFINAAVLLLLYFLDALSPHWSVIFAERNNYNVTPNGGSSLGPGTGPSSNNNVIGDSFVYFAIIPLPSMPGGLLYGTGKFSMFDL